jgi:hypothetical protein
MGRIDVKRAATKNAAGEIRGERERHLRYSGEFPDDRELV